MINSLKQEIISETHVMRTFFLFIFILSAYSLFAQQIPGVHSGFVRIKVKPETSLQILQEQPALQRQAVSSDKKTTLSVGIASIDRLNEKYKATRMTRVFPYAGEYEPLQEKHGLHLWYDIEVDEGENPLTVVAGYQVDGNIELAQPLYKIRNIGEGINELNSAISPKEAVSANDPDFSKQWHYSNTGQSGGTAGVDIRLPEAWEQSKGSSDVIVAVVDGGVDYLHEDLRDNMWINTAELNGTTGQDDDRNGYIDDIYGYNFVSGLANNVILKTSHGTHVAGTIAARTNNTKGVAGIAGGYGTTAGVKIMSCQIFLEDDKRPSNTAAAITYAANNGAVILQNSWGYTEEGYTDAATLAAIRYFIANAGKKPDGTPRAGTKMVGGIVIFAAGNDNSNGNWYPGRYEEVLTVASVNHYGRRAYYSNYGSWIDISAPGGDTQERERGGVYSTLPDNTYGYMQGTSMACPHVSGVAALILSKFGSSTYTPDKLRDRLLLTASSLRDFDPGNYQNMGAGLLDAKLALTTDNRIAPDAITDLVCTGVFSTSATLTWTAPADSDNENAYSYTIAASTGPLDISNFERAPVKQTLKALEAGDAETYRITGLENDKEYYIAVRSQDLWGNKSAISNVVTATTRNSAPVSKGMPPVSLLLDEPALLKIGLDTIFTDPDGDAMRYTITSPAPAIIEAGIDQKTLMLYPVALGQENLQITATDVLGLSVSDVLPISVITLLSSKTSESSGNLKIWPNPVSSVLNYSFITERESMVEIKIYNAQGALMMKTPRQAFAPGTHLQNINISSLAPGIYFLEYITGNKLTGTKKIIKQ